MDGDLIQIVNRLQETFSTIGGETVDLPQIVVVGSQSSGKSSVLETVVGRDFLPRGAGIVTRRPLVLQLIHVEPPKGEHGEFLHVDKRFESFDDIRKEIESETLRVAGQNKGISKLPIHLKIFSPHVLNLTLVDLPGLTKIPVGDQPTDIERQIRSLVLDYISKPNCVILAVSPANVDLANSDSLKLARSVDPQGRRTIGVLTKLDLMDSGTNALDILTGRVYPLKLGFIGVVNRSQQDINENLDMKISRGREEEFFKTHVAYRNIAHRCGTPFLAKTLNTVLMNHIRDKLPDMKARLNTLMGQTQQELASFGPIESSTSPTRGALILKLMTQFARDFVSSIDGTSIEISTKELCGGARIYYIFNEVFGNALETIDPVKNLGEQDVRTAIRNSTGPRGSLFVPEVAFDLLVKPQIKLLEPPSLRCVELVYEELMKICHNCTSSELERYPRLHAQLIECVSELLRERLGPTSDYVQSLIAIQTAYINTNHPSFVHGSLHGLRQQTQPPTNAVSTRQALAIRNGEKERSFSEGSSPDPGSGAEDEEEPSPTSASHIVNGLPSRGTHRPSTSLGIERPSSAPPKHLGAGASGPVGANQAKDSFLNYFFGGAPQVGGRAPINPISSGLTSREDSFLNGRKGQQGAEAAWDMKSLEKHIEPASLGGVGTGEGMAGVSELTQREEMEIQLIRSLILTYFNIVRQTIQDLVPKAVMHLLVNFSRETVQNRLVATMYKEQLFDDLLHEDEALTAERARLKSLLDVYREAFKTLQDAF
ncbi:dynamin protein dnm1 [Atractiella rhizophila]|nr:dynamin protein dnm1 [Atractiella rhizophila]